MQLEIGLAGADEELVRSLYDWISQERIAGAQVETKTEPPAPGQMGVALSAILSVVLGAPAVVALVRCLQAWVTQRRPKADVVIKSTKAGITVIIHTENMPKPELLVDHLVPLLQAADQAP